jgi:hypothetical protein
MASDSELQGVLPALIQAKDALRTKAKAKGVTFTIADDGGLRTAGRTAQLIQYRTDSMAKARILALHAGASAADAEKAAQKEYYRVSPAEKSYHTVGAAFDIAIVRRPPGMSWDDGYKTIGMLAQSVGLRWGGYFSAPRDVFHFELREPRATYAVQFAQMIKTGGATTPRGTASGMLLAVVLVGIGAALYYGS